MRQPNLFDDAQPSEPSRADAPQPDQRPTREEREALLLPIREVALICTRCHLSESRANVVFGEGNPAAPLVFVGEGPGETEDATGRPFVGRAGKVLDQLLRENGMTREHVYICNIVKCRAADRKDGRWVNRAPSTEEVAACRPWLEQQLQAIQPLVVVCVGGPAAKTLIKPNFAITRERGQWFTHSPLAPYITAILHPAYLLRLHGPNGDAARQQCSADIGAARRKVIEARRERKEAAPPPEPPQQSLFDA